MYQPHPYKSAIGTQKKKFTPKITLPNNQQFLQIFYYNKKFLYHILLLFLVF